MDFGTNPAEPSAPMYSGKSAVMNSRSPRIPAKRSRSSTTGSAGRRDLGGRGDEGEVAAEAGAERERPPVGVVHPLALEPS
jgi:hypothetical protein